MVKIEIMASESEKKATFKINYSKFYRRIKLRYPSIEKQINSPPELKSIDDLPHLYSRYVRLCMGNKALHNFDTRIRFIAVICLMSDANFFDDDDSPVRKGLASKLADVLGSNRSAISHTFRTVKNYWAVYPVFREEVEYFCKKLKE